MLTKIICPRYDEMKACWRSEPDSRPTFTVLAERMSSVLCSGVRDQYLQLSSTEESSSTTNSKTLPRNFRLGATTESDQKAEDNLGVKTLQRQMTVSNPGYKCSFNS